MSQRRSLDRRAKALSLTKEGRRLAESIEEELVRLRRQVLRGIDQADRRPPCG